VGSTVGNRVGAYVGNRVGNIEGARVGDGVEHGPRLQTRRIELGFSRFASMHLDS
jgi:hypothetical protein